MAENSPTVRFGTTAGRMVIAATVLGSGMASIDSTVVGIALPTIGREFHATLGSLQWVVTGYTMALAALLLTGGSLGDNYGRRKIFCIGVVWFDLASVASALAPGTTFLIFTRVLQGVGAALLTPASLAILQATFDPKDRGRAIGAWSGLGGVAVATGPLLGGYLISAASWRWIFLINIPIGAAVLILGLRYVPETHDPTSSGHVDILGAVFAMSCLAGLTYALIEGPSYGWTDLPVLVMLLLGVISAIVFVIIEKAVASPMLPLSVFRVRQFSATNVVTFIVYSALGGALFLLPVELQITDGYSPLQSGVSLLPLTVIMLVFSARSGRLASRIGPRLQMSVGPVVVGLGFVLLTRATDDRSYLTGVLPAVLVFGAGLAITVAPLTTTALAALPAEHAGLASAVNNDVARLGSLIAVAILPAIVGISGTSYLHPQLLARGFRSAVLIAAVMCAIGGLIAAFGIENPPVGDDHDKAAPEAHELLHCALDAAPLTAER